MEINIRTYKEEIGGIALVYRTWNLFVFVVFPIGERNGTDRSKQDEGPA